MNGMEEALSPPRTAQRLQGLTSPMFQAGTYASWGYLLLGLPLAVIWFSLLVPLYLVGGVLIVIWVGFGILAVTQLLSRSIGLIERGMAQSWLGARIPRPAPAPSGTLLERGRALLTDEFGWRVLMWTFVRLITGILGFVGAIVALVVPIALLLAPVTYVWVDPPLRWEWTLWLAPLFGIPAFFAAAHLIRLLGKGSARLAEMVLGSPASGAVEAASKRAERAEEQVRIDQELHDTIGHVLTMNVVQAGAGAHVFDRDPEFAREALTNIERRGREALAELDRIIGLVRSDEPARRPVPELADIETMIDEIEEAGMAIEKHLAPPPTTPEIGRAAYRVVQEALTNVAKHAPGAATRVSVIGTDGWLEIEVVNTPPDQPPVHTVTGTGSGLSGIRQRVEILGGQSEAGPTPEGGFRVYASLPAMGKDRA